MEPLKSHADLAAILQGIAEGITVQAPDGSLIYANDAAARQSGYPTAEAMLQAPLTEIMQRFQLYAEDGSPFPLEQLPGRLALRCPSPLEIVLRFRTLPSGEERWSAVRAAAVRDEHGVTQFVVNSFRDVTQLKRAEARQRFLAGAGSLLGASLEYETTLASVAQLAVPEIGDWCAVDVVREDGSIHRLAIAHVDPDKVRLAAELQERYPPDPAATTGVPHVLRTGQSELYPEIPDAMLVAGAREAEHLAMLRALGLRSAMIVPLKARGRTLGAITIVTAESHHCFGSADLAVAEALAARAALAIDNARLYRRLEQELQTRDEFLAAVSHDLKNPLTAIKAATQLLDRSLARAEQMDSERLRSSLSSIDSTTNHMAKLLEGLLDVTRVQLGQALELDRAPVDLVALARAVVAEYQQTTDCHSLRVEGVERLVGSWDGPRLERVLGNLLSNAIKYSPEGGEIAVSVIRQNGEAVLAVHDRGIGIPPADRPYIFDRFRRGSNVMRRIGGSGIGLTGASQIVEQHGGTIAVSERAGGGTTFTVRLPLEGHS